MTAGDRTGQKILLVDDEEMVLRVASLALTSGGFTVLEARSAAEAEALFLAEADIDLLLTDLSLPGSSGPELARSLKRRDERLRVMYTSGYAREGLPQHLIPDPGSLLLTKPYTLRELTARVRDQLDS